MVGEKQELRCKWAKSTQGSGCEQHAKIPLLRDLNSNTRAD